MRSLAMPSLACVILASGCGLASPTADGADSSEGHRVAVPALWADPGAGASGIEEATVWAGTIGPPGFNVHLDSIEAQGAGAAWTAASSTAAAVATMYSGLDPATVDIDFTITGPIDGPSAGGILTVGALAALKDIPLRADMTMTGTISPDGSIGAVGGIGLKLQAAADAGFATVLLPAANMQFREPGSQDWISAEARAESLGINVSPVSTVAGAFEAFTDRPLISAVDTPYQLTAPVLASGERTSATLIEIVRTSLSALPSGIGTEARGDLDLAEAALANGDAPAAYGLAVDALIRAARLRGEREAIESMESGGSADAQAMLIRTTRAAIARGEARLSSASAVTGLTYEQQLATPSALGWITYSLGVLRGLEPRLDVPLNRAEILAAARIIAEQEASIDILAEDALAVVEAMGGTPAPPAGQMAAFLSHYTNFLVRAGRANQEYLGIVTLPASKPEPLSSDAELTSLLPVVSELQRLSEAIPQDENSLADEIRQSATALSYFAASTGAVTAGEALRSTQFDTQDEESTPADLSRLAESVKSSNAIVSAVAGRLGAEGFDVGYPAWSARWGVAAFERLNDRERGVSGAVLALNELWYDVITMLMMNAGPSGRMMNGGPSGPSASAG